MVVPTGRDAEIDAFANLARLPLPCEGTWLEMMKEVAQGLYVPMAISSRSTDGLGDQILEYANPPFCELVGYELEDMEGRSARLLDGRKTEAEARRNIRYSLEAGRTAAVKITTYNKHNQGLLHVVRIQPVYEVGGETFKWTVTLQMDASAPASQHLDFERLGAALPRKVSPNLLQPAPSRSERTWTRWVYGGVCLAAVLASGLVGQDPSRDNSSSAAPREAWQQHDDVQAAAVLGDVHAASAMAEDPQQTPPPEPQFGLDDAMSVCMPLVLLVVLVPIYRAQKDLSNVSETVQHLMKRQSLDNLVHERYSVMMAPLLRGSVCVACFAFVVPLASKVSGNHEGSKEPLFEVLTLATYAVCIGMLSLLHRMVGQVSVMARLPIYRTFVLGADVLFRCQRIGDLLKAPDRVAFIRTTADVVGHDFSLPSVYSCLYLGYVMGLVRPTTLSGMVAFMLFGLVLPLAPPGLAYAITGERRWLVAVLRSVTLPTTLGILIESMQQRLICHLLEKTICTELALALPDAPPLGIAADDSHAPFAPDSLNASFEGSLSGSFSRGSFIRGGPRSSGSGDGDGEGSGDVGGSNDSSHSGRSGKGCSFPEEGGSYSRRRDSDELTLSDFEPVGILGFGGSAQVRLMRNLKDGGTLQAVKSVFKRRVDGTPLDERAVDRVQEEKAVMRAAHNHVFIVTLMATFEDAICYHLVLEYASSGPLSQWLIREPFGEPVARLVTAEIVAAIEHLHDLQIIFRDLKPDNVLVRASGHVVLADFGISKRLDARGGSGGFAALGACSVVGTPGFIAPEVISRNREVDANGDPTYGYPIDWWALGVLLHSMLTLEEPLHVQTVIDFLQMPTEKANELTWERIDVHVSEEARALLCQLLTFETGKRLGTVGGAGAVKAHPFFAAIDWERLVQLELPPPLPNLTQHSVN